MASFAAWPLFLVDLQPLWGLSNFATGWISGGYFIGYVLATPALVGLTDRIDAKYIYVFSSLLAFTGALCFAFFAAGFWSAALCWGLVGAGLAGTYMPGLQILNARLGDRDRIKLLPYYTSAFGVGTGLSFFLMGWMYAHTSWQNAFFLAAIFSLFSAALIFFIIRPSPPVQTKMLVKRHPLDFRPAFRNKPALGYIFAYGAHNFELFAYRGWLFAYLIFASNHFRIEVGAAALSSLMSVFAIIGYVGVYHWCVYLPEIRAGENHCPLRSALCHDSNIIWPVRLCEFLPCSSDGTIFQYYDYAGFSLFDSWHSFQSQRT